jgi:hypothetical protein
VVCSQLKGGPGLSGVPRSTGPCARSGHNQRWSNRAELDLALFPGLALAPLLRRSIGRVAWQFFEELKHYA